MKFGFQNWVLESDDLNVVRAVRSPAHWALEASIHEDVHEQ